MKGLDLSAPFRQLMERRLWPVALLLLAGLAAVPMLLAKDAETPAVPAAAVPAGSAPAASTQPVVSVADIGRLERSRKVLGARKDPFRPARAPRAAKADTGGSQIVRSVASAPAAGGSTGTQAPASTGGSAAPVAPTPVTAPVATEPKYALYAPVVRFGSAADAELPKMTLMRLAGLPSVKDPVVMYLGLMRDWRTAVFLVDRKAAVQGDGKCFPSADDCRTVRLKVGETALLDYVGSDGTIVQRKLTVVRVAKGVTTEAAVARRWRAATAKGGREALRERLGQVVGHRYDQATGTIQSTDSK